MMQYVIRAYDGADVLEKRMAVRPRHLENMARIRDRILCSGGLLDGQGNMKGSLLVLNVESRAILDEYLRTEPYILEGVWEKIEVEAMNVVFLNGETVGK